jgi:hypothetical protein
MSYWIIHLVAYLVSMLMSHSLFWLVGRLVSCLAGFWLVVWFVGWLAGFWLIYWIFRSFVCWLVVSFIYSFDIDNITIHIASCCTSVHESVSITIAV